VRKLFLVSLMVVLAIALILSSCTQPEPSPAPTPEPSPTPAPAPAPSPAAEETFELIFTSWIPEQNEMSVIPGIWAEALEEQTGGRVKVTLYYAQSLGQATEYLDMLNSGACDIAVICSYYYAGNIPILSTVLELPGLIPNRFVSAEIHDALWHKGLLDEEFVGLKPLWWQPAPSLYLIFRDKKVTKLEDLEGMKIRGGGPITNQSIEALGASPVGIPAPEIYMSLSTGVVDGANVAAPYHLTMKFQEVSKYYLWEPLSAASQWVIMSQKTWDSLPTDIQLIMEQLNVKAKYQFLEHVYGEWPDVPGQLRDVGMDVYTLSPEESARWKTALEPVYDGWLADMEAKGLPGQEALETARQVVARLTK
jgi:TRAP-type C4-dicarboxylate transport system substrate-binding protein